MHSFIGENKKNLLFGAAALTVIAAVFLLLPSTQGGEADEEDWESFLQGGAAQQENKTDYAEEETVIIVDIKGEVVNPGIYIMEQGDRVNDAIIKAGGTTEDAAEEAVNLAEKVYDEMVIAVPAAGEDVEVIFQGGGGDSDKVRINHASAAELVSLPGIGPAKAEAILKYREEAGPFKSEEELVNVPGIGEKTMETLKELISVK